MKLYIVSCPDKDIFSIFAKTIQNTITNTIVMDYDNFKLSIVEKMFGTLYEPNSNKVINLVDNITTYTTKFNDLTFISLIKRIDELSTNRTKLFINCNNVKVITKIKRHFGRNMYYTIFIDNTVSKYNNFKYITLNSKRYINNYIIDKLKLYNFDSKLSYIDNTSFKRFTKKFIINKLGISFIKI